MNNPEFDPVVVKNASTACEGLCKWVRAMEVYERVAKVITYTIVQYHVECNFPLLQVVAPKKLKLAEAEGELAVQMGKLNAKRAELKEVRSKSTIALSIFLSGIGQAATTQ